MLIRLHVRDLAVLDDVELELATGFSALTGETGAGKSMLVDALALALGERADSTVVRRGAARAEVTAIFDLGCTPAVAEWLSAHDLDASGECQLRRAILAEGRSRGYVNGRPVPLELLRELGEQLVEICGQHAHQSLVRRPAQREMLDAHGGHGVLLATMRAAFESWNALQAERTRLQENRRERSERRELVEYQWRELEALGLHESEFEALEQEALVLANAGRISAGLSLLLERLHDAEGAAGELLGTAVREVAPLSAMDAQLAPALESLESARIHLDEAVEQIRRRHDAIEQDPERQDAVESRLSAINSLARKHATTPEALWKLAEVLHAELDGLGAGEERLGVLDQEIGRLAQGMRDGADALHAARVKAAGSLEQAVTANLRSLGMADSRFVVGITGLATASPTGADEVEFRLGTHAGQAPLPIARVASGGELSRLSLAIQVVTMTGHGAPTLIFDEVDAGIGGGVAEIVGQCLRRLSESRQVLCVTHLAQVASQANHHYAVSKSTSRGETRTNVQELAATERVEEIARMLGGVKVTERSRDHAREMLLGARPRRAG